MSCFSPLRGWYSKNRNPSGKRSIVFSRNEGFIDREVEIPCGSCDGCKLERSRQWAVRCYHEAQLHDMNCFITLTFDDKNLNQIHSLVKRDFQLFMKRLRKRFCSASSDPHFERIAYFHCGEYGDKFNRPHHHACLFGFDFPDKVLFSSRKGVNLYTSRILSLLWPHGFSTIGEVNFETAAYVARYVLKKAYGSEAKDHYDGRVPEYITMSRRPGIAGNWLPLFESDVYPQDCVVLKGGQKVRPPKYYDRKYELTNAKDFARLRRNRVKRARENPDNTSERLEQREAVCKAKMKLLKRSFENG